MKIMVTGGAGFIGVNVLDSTGAQIPRASVRQHRQAHLRGQSRQPTAIEAPTNYTLPREFIRTNIDGTFNLLEACRKRWAGSSRHPFHYVSTNEVHGAMGPAGLFVETTGSDPSKTLASPKKTDPILGYATDPQTGFLPYPRSEYPVGVSTS